jgi:hypothetical protein
MPEALRTREQKAALALSDELIAEKGRLDGKKATVLAATGGVYEKGSPVRCRSISKAPTAAHVEGLLQPSTAQNVLVSA